MNNIISEKIEQAIQILNEKDIDLWLTFVRESATNHDPIMDLIVGTNVTWQSAFLINKNGDTTVIVGSLDEANMKLIGKFKNVIGYVQSIKEPLNQYLNKYKPQKIAINYSIDSNLADGLSYGMYLSLQEYLKETDFINRFVSSEDIISSLRGRKSKSEISFIKKAIEETENIFDEVTKFLAVGKSEIEVAYFIKDLVKKKNLELAWEEETCPSVFTGPDTAGAHSGPTDRKIQKGHILNIDFGVKYNGYCSDMQRTWYILKANETKAPLEVQKGFDVIYESIQKAAKTIKPNVKGYEVDDVARKFIVENGYEEFQHALGHQVGKAVHDGGAGLFPRWERYGKIPYLLIEEKQVFTIEPRLTVKDYGVVTIEEMIQVTKNGCEFLSHPQKELILIK
ncbi:MAG: Xaa-Pro peptidase family protein [Ignavibacterium sp.]